MQTFPDASGWITTMSLNGPIDPKGAFFQSLGSNGRSCATCHVASQGMSISSSSVRQRFQQSQGADPLFAPIDGGNCPNARAGSSQDHSLLLKNGLIRVFMAPPANAEFSISLIHDPYGCALTPNPDGGAALVSVYRRPLPSTNVGFLSSLMFDGRETKAPLSDATSFVRNLLTDLTQQASDAVLTHAQARQPPSPQVLQEVVSFELGLYTAQSFDRGAGALHQRDAHGGPRFLADVLAPTYYPGINDSLGADPDGHAFDSAAMTLYAAWSGSLASSADLDEDRSSAARGDIAAGERLFNTAPVHIAHVRGLNDNPALGSPATFTGTCTTCHDNPDVGNHSLPLPLDIGTAHATLPGLETDPEIAAGLAELSMPDLPVYLISGCPSAFGAGQPESFYTTDPAKALVTGLCSDFNRGKGPILRGLASRAPYFHNGAAASLHELVNFYDKRFQMGLTNKQKRQLEAFLDSL